MALIKDVKSNEGTRHWRAKTLLFDIVTDGGYTFIDFYNKRVAEEVSWDYASMEAYATENGASCIPIYQALRGTTIEEMVKKNVDRFDGMIGEYNRNIVIKDGVKIAYANDPLNYCKYSQETDIRFIFDIALGSKGVYHTVIEIVDKSPVRRDKKEFCEKWGIDLITIKCDDVLNNQLVGRKFVADISRNEIDYDRLATDGEFEEVV